MTTEPETTNETIDRDPEDVAERIFDAIRRVASNPLGLPAIFVGSDIPAECECCKAPPTRMIEVAIPFRPTLLVALCADHTDTAMRLIASKIEANDGQVTGSYREGENAPLGWPGRPKPETV